MVSKGGIRYTLCKANVFAAVCASGATYESHLDESVVAVARCVAPEGRQGQMSLVNNYSMCGQNDETIDEDWKVTRCTKSRIMGMMCRLTDDLTISCFNVQETNTFRRRLKDMMSLTFKRDDAMEEVNAKLRVDCGFSCCFVITQLFCAIPEMPLETFMHA